MAPQRAQSRRPHTKCAIGLWHYTKWARQTFMHLYLYQSVVACMQNFRGASCAAARRHVAAAARAPPAHGRPKLLPKLGAGEQQERPEQQQTPAALLAVRRQAEAAVEGGGRRRPEAWEGGEGEVLAA